MEKATINGATLEYEVKGAGEPVLLIGGAHVAGSYVPILSEPSLARYRLIRYHKRGLAGSTHTPPPVSIADHAADAAGLMSHLGIRLAHVVGHSSGGDIALQLALDHPEAVHTLCLLEPAMFNGPSASAFFEKAGPSVTAYNAGAPDSAVAVFLSAVSGLPWETCRSVINEQVPGGVAQAIRDADTFFTTELPALTAWALTAVQAASIYQPALIVTGARTEPVFAEAGDLLRGWLKHANCSTIGATGHLLHMQHPTPVAQTIAEFLGRHPND